MFKAQSAGIQQPFSYSMSLALRTSDSNISSFRNVIERDGGVHRDMRKNWEEISWLGRAQSWYTYLENNIYLRSRTAQTTYNQTSHQWGQSIRWECWRQRDNIRGNLAEALAVAMATMDGVA